ncbi:hypothetical protein L6452_05212 [Arctium lappa]|uniref:Uncharacterized protein n=1 Tax=Arctium lappa TaxID=4217 RepID=A0ACB9EFF4_ARCLA|nr:hypothetical protein L6452_05212 [Arctium lappa]
MARTGSRDESEMEPSCDVSVFHQYTVITIDIHLHLHLNDDRTYEVDAMGRTQWQIRSNTDDTDYPEIYGIYPTLIMLKIHHGGVFTKKPGRLYVSDKINFVDLVDTDEFFVHELSAMLADIGYKDPVPMYYHFRVLDMDLDYGLKPLGNDDDVLHFFKYFHQWDTGETVVEKDFLGVNVDATHTTRETAVENDGLGVNYDESHTIGQEGVNVDQSQVGGQPGLDIDLNNINLTDLDMFYDFNPFEDVNNDIGNEIHMGHQPGVNLDQSEVGGQPECDEDIDLSDEAGVDEDIALSDGPESDEDISLSDEVGVDDIEIDMT